MKTTYLFEKPCKISEWLISDYFSAQSGGGRKVSSISASETSDHDGAQDVSPTTEDPPNVFPPPLASGSTTAAAATTSEAAVTEKDLLESHLFDMPNEEDHLEQNMPWLRVMTKLLNSFNYHCTHQTFCHPQCYRRQMRAARRIMEAARHVIHVILSLFSLST